MAHRSISQRIAGDRGRAGFFAFIVALPPLAAALGFLYLGYRVITEDLAEDGVYIWLGAIAVMAFVFYSVWRWTLDGVRAALTPQRVQAMWLRRFHAERGGAFRTSRVVDQLSRFGIAPLTLQDSDVRLSFEQRRNRLAPTFWFFFAPIALVLAYLGYASYNDVQASFANQHVEYSDNLGEALVEVFVNALMYGLVIVMVIAVFVMAALAAALLLYLAAAVSGPLGAMVSRRRDDFRGLPRLLERLKRGKGRRGAFIVRISDEHWREAVISSLGAVDVAIIDLSDVSEHVAWEISEAVRSVGASGLVFIRREGVKLSDQARAAVRNALGRDPAHILTYPDRAGGNAKRFARVLREQIYSAADLRDAMRA